MSTDFSENWVNEYIQNIEEKMTIYVDDVDTIFEQTQEKLWAHFNAFVERVKKRFDKEILENCIEDQFQVLSPAWDS